MRKGQSLKGQGAADLLVREIVEGRNCWGKEKGQEEV